MRLGRSRIVYRVVFRRGRGKVGFENKVGYSLIGGWRVGRG